MNKLFTLLLVLFLVCSCHGKSSTHELPKSTSDIDSILPSKNLVMRQKSASNLKDTVSGKREKKIVQNPLENKVPTNYVEVKKDSADIWSKGEIAFLKAVDTIQLFLVKTTDIGSRKLEFDSQLTDSEKQKFISILFEADNYPKKDDEESYQASETEFEPTYQMLLVSKGKQLTLMFDVANKKLLVANLYRRQQHAISNTMVAQVEKLKKKIQ